MKIVYIFCFLVLVPFFLFAPYNVTLESQESLLKMNNQVALFNKDEKATSAFKEILNVIGYDDNYFKENKKMHEHYNYYHFVNVHTYFEKYFPLLPLEIKEQSINFLESKISYDTALSFICLQEKLIRQKKDYFVYQFDNFKDEMSYCGFKTNISQEINNQEEKRIILAWAYQELSHYTFLMQQRYFQLHHHQIQSKLDSHKRKSIKTENHSTLSIKI
jgi:hypothetical protein